MTTRPMSTPGWALFLAVSWTWCIGMYLPSLFTRDGGIPYFLVFLVPNVLGAASVGFVLRTPDRSRRFVETRRTAMLWFSAVTVAFQAYFLAWQSVAYWRGPTMELAAGVAAGAGVVGLATLVRSRVDWVPATAAIGCTLLCAAALLSRPPGLAASEPFASLVGLAMVTSLGFGLCPYLDLTFNRAAQHATRPRAAFGLGFFVVFLGILLVATRGRAIWMPADAFFEMPLRWVFLASGLHFGAQIAFTVLAHAAAVSALRTGGEITLGDRDDTGSASVSEGRNGRASLRRWIVVPACLGLAIGAGVPFAPRADLPGFVSAISAGEVGYRLFLGAYGLLFPVWLLMTMSGQPDCRRDTLAWTATTCVLAGPFLWIGAVGRNEVWLIPGVTLILLAAASRWVLARRASAGGLVA